MNEKKLIFLFQIYFIDVKLYERFSLRRCDLQFWKLNLSEIVWWIDAQNCDTDNFYIGK